MNGAAGQVRHFVRSIAPQFAVNALRRARRQDLFGTFRRAGVVFIHVPRVAGTSISHALYPHWINHFTVAEHLETFPDDLIGLPRFAVVRNPWERAVSSWSFARAGAGAEGVVVNRAGRYQGPQFQSFERFVTQWLPKRNLERVDPIFREQSAYLLDRQGRLAVDHIGRLEDLRTTERWLADLLGAEKRFARLNVSEHGDYRDYYTPELMRMVAKVYARDIDLFGYRF